jgi:hypothetical protein
MTVRQENLSDFSIFLPAFAEVSISFAGENVECRFTGFSSRLTASVPLSNHLE